MCGKNRKTPFLLGFTYRIVLIAAAAALALSYISIYINPLEFSVPLFFGLYYIPILFINIFLLIVSIIGRSKGFWITAIILLPSLIFTDLFIKFGGNTIPESEGIKLKIESYNVGMFSSGGNKATKQENRDAIIEHLKDNNPDIVCFQEFYINSPKQIDSLFPDFKYKYHHLYKIRNGKYFGNLTISKFPIINNGKLSFKGSTNLSIYTDIDHYGRIIRIYNNHLESYNISLNSLLEKLNRSSNVSSDELKNNIVIVHEKMLGSFKKRSEQVNKIMENIKSSSYPSIICGDFNDTPMSYTYFSLAKKHKDSFRESGRGYGASFIPLWPLLRIDYILFPQDFECINHITHKIKLSDHYPISAEIII